MKKREMEEYLKILNRDRLRNINIINFIENNHIYSIETVENSMIVRGRSDRDWVYLMCQNKNELNKVNAKLSDKDRCFGAIEDWMIPVLTEGKKVIWNIELEQFYLPNNIELPEPKHEVAKLFEKDAETVYYNSDYKDFLSIEYIVQRINNGISKGVFEKGSLVGWCLTHDDGALGSLHVMDEARRKGYGLSITLALINEVRNAEKIPFVYVEHNNVKSLGLVKKLGFVRQKDCRWFEIE